METCIWRPFTNMKTARPPLRIARANGCYLYTEEGERYLDAISSWWVNLHGHAHPYIAERIKAQVDILEHVILADCIHRPAVELATRLLSILPGSMSKVFYSDNGSTAVETALKIALQYWHNQNIPKTKVVCLKNSFHGETFGAMSVAGRNHYNRPFWNYLFDVEQIEPHSLDKLQAILAKGDVACFIFEPLILGAGGMIIYTAEELDALIRCCKEHRVITIADEVMTGFGRTGTLFACEQLTETVDMMCLSKGITGGFLPLAVTTCTEEIFNAFIDHTFLHGHSYTGNPLACVSALASLDLLLSDSCTLQREMIASSHKRFCEEWAHHPKLKRCESIGTILVLEYLSPTNHKDFFLSKGILLRPLGNVHYILPPYCINQQELEIIYDQIITTLNAHCLIG